MGLGDRWPEVARTYADVNMLFGDIVKVTPSSKVVGDLALFLVSHGMTCPGFEQLGPDHNLTIPNSVVDMFMGSLGQPPGGSWPKKIKQVVLRGNKPNRGRPGANLKPADFEETAARNWRRRSAARRRVRPAELPAVPGGLPQVRGITASSTAIWRCCRPRNSSTG